MPRLDQSTQKLTQQLTQKNTHQNRQKPTQTPQGFTMIELALSIVIISLLSFTVALVANAITAIADKGFTIKSVNSVGSDLIDSFTTAISVSPAADFASLCDTNYTDSTATLTSARGKCIQDNAYKFVFSERRAKVRRAEDAEDDESYQDVQLSGVFCTGTYSYVWNTGYAFARNEYTGIPIYLMAGQAEVPAASIQYTYKDGDMTIQSEIIRDFRLLRFEDHNRTICASRIANIDNQTTGYDSFVETLVDGNGHLVYTDLYKPITYDLTSLEFPGPPTELIPMNDNKLALYSLSVAKPAQDSATSRIFYSGSFVLATLRGGVNLFNTGDYCQIEGENADFNYCAINKFNFAAQALGK